MKKITIIFLLTSVSIFSQEKFKGHIEILNQEVSENYKTPSSILFIYEGGTHSINYCLDLTKKIKRHFKKKLKKEYKDFELKFNYNLNSPRSLKQDRRKIPSKKYPEELFEKVCFLSISKFKGWDNHLLEKRKQNYNLNILLLDSRTRKNDLNLLLNIYSTYTILTQNKNSSKLIVDNILRK